MKYEETYTGLQADVLALIKKIVPDAFTKNLQEAGVSLALPEDRELELKVKYDVGEDGGSLTIKTLWDNEIEDEEEEDKDDEEDKEDD